MGWLRWVERVEKDGGTRDDEYPQKVIQEKPMQPSLVEEKSQHLRNNHYIPTGQDGIPRNSVTRPPPARE